MCKNAQHELGCPASVSGRGPYRAHLRGRAAAGRPTHDDLPSARCARRDPGCSAVLQDEHRLYAHRAWTQRADAGGGDGTCGARVDGARPRRERRDRGAGARRDGPGVRLALVGSTAQEPSRGPSANRPSHPRRDSPARPDARRGRTRRPVATATPEGSRGGPNWPHLPRLVRIEDDRDERAVANYGPGDAARAAVARVYVLLPDAPGRQMVSGGSLVSWRVHGNQQHARVARRSSGGRRRRRLASLRRTLPRRRRRGLRRGGYSGRVADHASRVQTRPEGPGDGGIPEADRNGAGWALLAISPQGPPP